jgi:hypothetical protein
MKIGVMTRWTTKTNYGQILQCFALQKYLRDAGHDVYLIRYEYHNDYTKKSIFQRLLKLMRYGGIVKYCHSKIKKMLYDKEKGQDLRQFRDFCKQYIHSSKIYKSYSELLDDPPQADIYITGSDQVFGTERKPTEQVLDKMKAFFLAFGKKDIRRMSYAASFGLIVVDDIYKQQLLPLLNDFEFISLREEVGVDICKQAGYNNAIMVPDPTLLLAADTYKALYLNEKVVKPTQPYCFLYLLNHEDDIEIKKIYDWAKIRKLEVIYVASSGKFDKYKKIYPSIPQWIYLIENAEYVITHSYHCSIFCLHFHKKFAVIPQIGQYSTQNSRLESLFKLFNMKSRFINDSIDIVDAEINWDSIMKIFSSIRAMDELLKNIENKLV